MTEPNTPAWVRDAVFYQIFPDRFAKSNRVSKPANLQPWGATPTFHGYQGGDLAGIVEKLDYLSGLGINAIYLNPIFASASNHRYHTFDYFRIDPILGNLEDFKQLLAAAHARNIRVILDGVFNHASRGFYHFNHLLENGVESPYRDWFMVYSWPINAFAQHEQPNYAAWWGLHALPKFNIHTPAVRDFLWSAATYWLEQGIDGWRLDVPGEIDDDAFWREFRVRCRAVNPEAYIVGELWHEAHRWLRGDQFDGQMNYMFNRAAIGYFVGHNADQSDTTYTGYGYIQPLNGHQFASELDRINNHLYHPNIVFSNLTMLGSHDTPRLLSVAGGDVDAVRLMFFCQMTVPGAPNIYYGDEIGLAGGRDPDCRRAFPWHDPGSWQTDLANDLRRFIALRHETVALRRGTFQILYADDVAVVYQRLYQGQRAIIALNAGQRVHRVVIGWPAAGAKEDFLRERLVGHGQRLQNGQEIVLPARSGRIWIN
jgi:cyclomaltodextrinase / maltogenic alpha-amylase / neopullulanase